jgi:glycosyltransferase involved in cell wall biosynthesis
MIDRLRIAVLSPVWFPVPPTGYGGIEWVVSLLADGLVEAGHDVTLFASGDSRTKAKLAYVYRHAPSEWIGRTHWDLSHALACIERADEFDVINDHTGMLGLLLGGLVSTPLVHTVHGPLDGESGELYERIVRVLPSAKLISLSLNQRRPRPNLPWIANCPNALDFSLYPVNPHPGDYLLFLGRMSAEKGCHRAIAVARELGLPLKIAGKQREPLEQKYFRELVEPHLGEQIEYLGEVNHGTKVELLQDARATLFPIEWEEPFGLVMIESMACGTPVIATRWGAVPEVIDHGRSGIIVDHYREMAAALAEADALDPMQIRAYAEQRFAPERMVQDYTEAYRLAIGAEAIAPPQEAAHVTAADSARLSQ